MNKFGAMAKYYAETYPAYAAELMGISQRALSHYLAKYRLEE